MCYDYSTSLGVYFFVQFFNSQKTLPKKKSEAKREAKAQKGKKIGGAESES